MNRCLREAAQNLIFLVATKALVAIGTFFWSKISLKKVVFFLMAPAPTGPPPPLIGQAIKKELFLASRIDFKLHVLHVRNLINHE